MRKRRGLMLVAKMINPKVYIAFLFMLFFSVGVYLEFGLSLAIMVFSGLGLIITMLWLEVKEI